MPHRPRGRWHWLAYGLLFAAVIAAIGVRYAISNAAPILRTRVVDSLSVRFKGKVELAELDVSLQNGLGVHGRGLRIFGPFDPNPSEPGVQPLISVEEFRFHTGLASLFRSPIHVHTVSVKGMVLNVPPKQDAPLLTGMGRSSGRITIVVDELQCESTQLVINTLKPGKSPLDFEIASLKMQDIGPDLPMAFDATLVNPKPIGNIHSQGKFGPFRELQPRYTPVSGEYSFTDADLGSLRGIGGILASTGEYKGTLGRLEVDGATDTPNFRLARSGHPVNLHTDFHAIVDGTDGDTYLEPVKAKFLHSAFTARGKVVRVKSPHGHDIELNVVMDQARIEDLLTLGVKTEPPVMRGPVVLRTQMNLPPGSEDISDRLKLDGTFKIAGALFSNNRIQDRIDALSLRAQGKPKLAAAHADVNVDSSLDGTFRLSDGEFTFTRIHFSVPGARSEIHGHYTLDGNLFDFHGTMRMDAKLSHMTTGWKSVLLKPVDPFFSKNGAGAEIPFKVTGTRSDPHFGLDFGHPKAQADLSPSQ